MDAPITPTDARRLIDTEGREHTLVLYFTKADGTARRMVCRYSGALSNHPDVMRVWDLEKGSWRSVNLTRIHGLKVLGVSRSAGRAADRTAEHATARRDVEPRLQAIFG